MSKTNRKSHHRPPSGKSQTQQHFRDESNINNIVDKHMRGPGRFGAPIGNPNPNRQPRFTVMPSMSYHEMMNTVTDMQFQFQSLSARTKGKFNNDVYQMLRWLENPNNRKEALEMGLVNPTEEEHAQMMRNETRQQVNLLREALAPEPPKSDSGAPKADPEAQPDYQKGTAKKDEKSA